MVRMLGMLLGTITDNMPVQLLQHFWYQRPLEKCMFCCETVASWYGSGLWFCDGPAAVGGCWQPACLVQVTGHGREAALL